MYPSACIYCCHRKSASLILGHPPRSLNLSLAGWASWLHGFWIAPHVPVVAGKSQWLHRGFCSPNAGDMMVTPYEICSVFSCFTSWASVSDNLFINSDCYRVLVPQGAQWGYRCPFTMDLLIHPIYCDLVPAAEHFQGMWVNFLWTKLSWKRPSWRTP